MSDDTKNVSENGNGVVRGSDWGSVVALAIHVVGGLVALTLGFQTEGTILITSGVGYKAASKATELVVKKNRGK